MTYVMVYTSQINSVVLVMVMRIMMKSMARGSKASVEERSSVK